MLSDTTFIIQSLIDHLFYLRSLREFCLNIQLSFYENNQNTIEIAEGLGKRYEELGREAINLAGGRIPNQIIKNGYFITDYTLNSELLTEKLFNVDINTNLTVEQINLVGFDDINEFKYDDEVLERVNRLNQNAIQLTKNFIDFCKSLRKNMTEGNLFSYSYPLIYTYMIEEAGLYVSDLERLQEKTSVDPTYIINFQYYFSNSMMRASQFMIGLSDPNQTALITNADNYRKSFSNLMKRYQQSSGSPDAQKILNEEAIELVKSFRNFLGKIIEGVLNNNYYFIVEPIFLDNLLTEVNYFLYLLQGSNLGIK